jgi:hypothetical protein
VRDLAFLDAQGNLRLYFSESSGAGGNGKIYYIDSRGAAVPFFTVNLREVDGFWAGNFAFDESGTLYLSSGNRVPAYLYRVEGGRVNRIYTSNSESISGFVVKRNVVYYANWRTEIKALDLSTMAVSSFRSQPSHKWISDVYV